MALKIHVSCSNHQKNDAGYGRESEIWIDTISDKEAESVKRHLEAERMGGSIQWRPHGYLLLKEMR